MPSKSSRFVPPFLRTAPARWPATWVSNSALSKVLDVKTRERIAIAVAQVNGCDYCLMPDGWAMSSAGDFPAMTGNVPFLMKDVVLLAVSVYPLKDDVVRIASQNAPGAE